MNQKQRAERSRLRAEEYKRHQRFRMVVMLLALGLYVVVPVLWYGAIEFGLVHPIHTPEFRNAVHMMGIITFLVFLTLYSQHLNRRLPKQGSEEEEDPNGDSTKTPTA